MCAARSDNINQRAPHRLEKPSTPVIFEVIQTAANSLNESAMRVVDRASEDEGTLRGSWARVGRKRSPLADPNVFK